MINMILGKWIIGMLSVAVFVGSVGYVKDIDAGRKAKVVAAEEILIAEENSLGFDDNVEKGTVKNVSPSAPQAVGGRLAITGPIKFDDDDHDDDDHDDDDHDDDDEKKRRKVKGVRYTLQQSVVVPSQSSTTPQVQKTTSTRAS